MVLCVGDTAVGGPLMLFTSQVRLLSLSEACQLVAHSFVQSPWYLEQSAWSLSGESFRGRKWLLRYNCTWKNWFCNLQFNFLLGLFTETLSLKSDSFFLEFNFSNLITQKWVTAPLHVKAQTNTSERSQPQTYKASVRARGGVLMF